MIGLTGEQHNEFYDRIIDTFNEIRETCRAFYDTAEDYYAWNLHVSFCRNVRFYGDNDSEYPYCIKTDMIEGRSVIVNIWRGEEPACDRLVKHFDSVDCGTLTPKIAEDAAYAITDDLEKELEGLLDIDYSEEKWDE